MSDRHIPSRLVAVTLSLLLLTASHGIAQYDELLPDGGDPSVPTLALEDTFAMPTTTLPEFLVEAPRVTLDEILKRVAAGEARRDSLMMDQTYTLLFRIVYRSDDPADSADTRIERDYVSRVYKKRPNLVHEIPIRSDGDEDFEIRASNSMSEQIVSFAFEAKARSEYHFEISERSFIGGHVIYKIGFTPKSSFDALPTGIVWVDTNEFVIVREEFWYRDQSPVPLFFKSIENCVVERSRVDGNWWVMTRFLARLETTSMLRLMGKIAGKKLSPTIDLSLEKIDWKVNSDLPDSLFVAGDS